MNELPVHNPNDHLMCLMLEPLGEDYWLKPGETFVVVYAADDVRDAMLWTVEATDHVQVWNTLGDLHEGQVLDGASGARLDCGHQRPPGAFSHEP